MNFFFVETNHELVKQEHLIFLLYTLVILKNSNPYVIGYLSSSIKIGFIFDSAFKT